MFLKIYDVKCVKWGLIAVYSLELGNILESEFLVAFLKKCCLVALEEGKFKKKRLNW